MTTLDARPYSWELIRSDRIWFTFHFLRRKEKEGRRARREKGSRKGGERVGSETSVTRVRWCFAGDRKLGGKKKNRSSIQRAVNAGACQGRTGSFSMFLRPTNVYPEHNYSITITITITMLLRLPLPLAHYHRDPFVPELSITLGNRMSTSALAEESYHAKYRSWMFAFLSLFPFAGIRNTGL